MFRCSLKPAAYFLETWHYSESMQQDMMHWRVKFL